MKNIQAADLFCGAGGTSSGLRVACQELGLPLHLVAINHWPIAVETHSLNHPDVEHVCAAIESVEPRAVVPGGHLDLLVASPECTHHSAARGGKPMSDQKRASAHLVLRWAEALRIDAILIENVPEFRTWGPLNAKGRPIERLKGSLYQHFIEGLRILGYAVEDRILNAADFGAATTRRRLFILARRRSRGPIVWPTPTHTPTGERTLFGHTKRWRPAREIIDWSIEGKSIFTRKKPLRPATMRRIMAGLKKFGGPALQPFVLQQQSGGVPRSVTEPLPTVAAKGAISLVEPYLVGYHTEKAGEQARIYSTDEPLPTLTTENRFGIAQPFLVPFLGERDGQDPRVRSIDDPLQTVTAQNPIGLVEPHIVKYYGSGIGATSVDDPLATVTTKDRFGLVTGEQVGYALDIRFRMLQPHELAAAMSFPVGYLFAGNKGDAVRQIGNAVDCRQAQALCRAVLEPLAKKKTRPLEAIA